MRRYQRRFGTFLYQSFARFGRVSAPSDDASWERILERLEEEPEDASASAQVAFDRTRSVRRAQRWQWPAVAAIAAAIVMAVFLPTRIVQSAPAVLEDAAGKRSIQYGELVRPTGDMSAILSMTDGPRVETASMSEFSLERTDDGGTRIHLNEGGLIVDAATKNRASLYVQTKDITALVSGAVSLVKAEEDGSRIAAIGGEIRVQQGATEKKLRSGEQVTTNPKMESLPVEEEIAWSRYAETHLALLGQAAVTRPVGATPTRETFEVASIRPYDPGAPTGGRGGRVWAVGGCSGDPQVDPARFDVTGATLHALIAWAYGTKAYGTSNAYATNCGTYAALKLISGGPEWIRLDQWDVHAAIPAGSPGYTRSQLMKGEAPKLQAMLQTLLEDRFQLVVRREIREVPAYALTLGKDAASQLASRETSSRIWNGSSYTSQWLTKRSEDWQPYSPGSVVLERGKNNESPEYYGYLNGADASMSDLVLLLGQQSGRPVLDRTGLTGTFHWFVKYYAEQPPNHSPIVGVLNSGDRAYLFKAIEQLGLKVEETKGPVEILVIDRVEKPSQN